MTKDNNIQGLGTDIIEIERIKQSIERHGQHFLDRVFTAKEQAHCLQFKDSAPHFAGRFAAKEAVAKALGTGFGESLSWQDVEVLGDEKGKPEVYLSEKAKQQFKNAKLLVSISHCHSHASAVAIYSQ